ncbi:flocculation protein FLO11-like [Pecten maximus]|uniref:flocculation protein FLO11-like n=1 Tax=Pecten maximus TaxID=6579 RepID=UPI0014587011|nr:flocculation protein FLO11-like [Pecten maximus]
MSSICGSPLRLQSKAKYPILELIPPPNLQMSKQTPNLSNRSSQKIVYRSKEEMEIMLNKTCSAAQVTWSQTVHNRAGDSQSQVPAQQEDNDKIFQCRNERNDLPMLDRPQSGNNLHCDVFSTSAAGPTMAVCHNSSKFTIGSSQPTLAPVNSSSQPAPAPSSRIVPSFTPKTCPSSKKLNYFTSSGSSTTCSQKTVPMFKPKNIGTIASNVAPSLSTSTGQRPYIQNFQKQPPTGVTCLSRENIEQVRVNGSALSQTATLPSMTPSFKPKPSSVSCGKDYFTGKSSQHTTHPQSLMSSSMWISSKKTSSGIPMGTSSTPQISVLPVPSTPKLHQVTPKGTPSTVSKKRLKQDEEETPKSKKPRVKPQIQDNLDVELFARANQLQKANAATLIAWLKDKGIQHKSKDKKSDLIDRVNTALGLAVEP